jgi:gliding motility-associated-like protein
MNFKRLTYLFLMLLWFAAFCNAQSIIADSGFVEHEAGRGIDTNSLNVQYVMKPLIFTDGWELSPISVRWDGRYWGGFGKYGDSIKISRISFRKRVFTTVQKEYNTLPPVFCPDDTIRGMCFVGGGYDELGRSGAIAMRFSEPLQKDSAYRLPFVYIHESYAAPYGNIPNIKDFSLNVFTSDTSVVYQENYSATWLSFDTLHNYEFVETLPVAHTEKWVHHWLEFTATAAQDGHDWMILHVPYRQCRGILMNFVDARQMIDVVSDQDTFVYCADTVVHLSRDTLYAYDSTQRMRPDGIFWGAMVDTFFYTTPDANGCRTRDYQHIEYMEKEAFTLARDSICDYDSMLLVADIEEYLSTTYLWSTGETTDSIELQDTGMYWVQVDQGFCQFKDTFYLDYLDKPVFTLGPDSFVCYGDSIQIGATAPDAIAYNWSTGEMASTIYVDSTVSAVLTISNANCYASDTIDIVSHLLPTISLIDDTTFCNTDSVWVDAISAGISNFVWGDGNTSAARWINKSGTFNVSFQDQYCLSLDSLIAYTDAPIPFSLGNDTAFCEGGSWTKDLTYLSADEYTWYTGTKTPDYTSTMSDVVSTIVRSGKCFTTDTIEVTVHPYPIFKLREDTILCETDSIFIGITAVADAYLWEDGLTEAQRWINSSGEYKLAVTTNNCTTRDSMTLSLDAVQFLDLPGDTTFCQDERLFIDGFVDNAQEYNWNDGETADSRWVDVSGKYVLNVSTRSCGELSDSLNVLIEQCQCNVWIPSAFSPNQPNSSNPNQLNNTFNPYIDCPLKSYSFKIYNRWGELIFESDDYKNKIWDGTYNGQSVPLGAYVWQLSYQLENAVITYDKGTVTVVK